MTITVDADAVGSITGLTVTRYGARGDDPWRVALPNGLVLGKATVADVLKVRGQPHEISEHPNLEGSWHYSFQYQQGPEGTHYVSYTVISDRPLGENVRADSVPARLRRSLVTVYSITDIPPE